MPVSCFPSWSLWFRSYYYTINWDKIQIGLKYVLPGLWNAHSLVFHRHSEYDHKRLCWLRRQSEWIYFGLYHHNGGKLHQTLIDLRNNLVLYYLCTWEHFIHLLHYFSVGALTPEFLLEHPVAEIMVCNCAQQPGTLPPPYILLLFK